MKIDIFRVFFRWYLKEKCICRSEIDINSIDTILVMSNTAIGDTLFSTPAIRSIKEKYPQKKIVVLLNPINYQLFKNNPYIDKVVLYRGKWKDFFRVVFQLRRLGVNLTFIMHSNEPQATPMAYCIGSKYIIKIPNDSNEFNFLHYNQPVSAESGEHFIDRRLKQLEYIGIHERRNYKMDIFPDPEWYSTINSLLGGCYIYIGFQMGASTKSRMWFIDKWIDLAEKLLSQNKKWCIVLTGSKSDQFLSYSLWSKVRHNDRVIDCAGRLDIGPAAALIDKLDLLVTLDTGPLHIAAAMNTPTVAISVAGSAVESNPRSDNIPHIFIQKPKTCTPCLDKKCKDQRCMLQVTTDEVFHHVCNIVQ